MNAVAGPVPRTRRPRPAAPHKAADAAVAARRLALLGTGTVGAAFVARYRVLQERGVALPRIVWLANSRAVLGDVLDPHEALARANAAPRRAAELQGWAEAEALRAGGIVVDATASDLVANWHPEWLARGVNVVTANKLGHGGPLARSQAIGEAQAATGAQYGDSATVGAGLPVLRSLRGLVAGGDRIHAVEGVLSGSMAWLFHRYDGARPFSDCVREALAAGYAEPDPRLDLSGEDVRRKLLILARAAGLALEPAQVRMDSLVPPALAAAPAAQADALLRLLDEPLAARLAQARRSGAQLRFVGRFDAHGAQVELRALPAGHPLCGGQGTDNRVAVTSDRYPRQPLVIQGPGAGADVTAAALLDDVLRISAG